MPCSSRLAVATLAALVLIAGAAQPSLARHRYKVVAEDKRVSTLIYVATPRNWRWGSANASPPEEFWAADADGSRRRLMFTTKGSGSALGPIVRNRNGGWLPCCHRIFHAVRQLGSIDTGWFYSINLDGSGRQVHGRFSQTEQATAAPPSQRSGRLAYIRACCEAIYVMEKTGRKRVVHREDPGAHFSAESMAISPSGTAVVFARRGELDERWELQRLPLGGSPSTFYRSDSDYAFQPNISSQGAQVVFRAARDEDSLPDIFRSNTLGFGAQRLTNTSGRIESWPIFNPKASRVAFTTGFNDGGADVWLMNGRGGGERRFAHRARSRLKPLLWINARWQRRKVLGH